MHPILYYTILLHFITALTIHHPFLIQEKAIEAIANQYNNSKCDYLKLNYHLNLVFNVA